MSVKVWYLLASEGSQISPGTEPTGHVECSSDDTIHDLKRKVKTENSNGLNLVDAPKLVVRKDGDREVCPPTCKISEYVRPGSSSARFNVFFPAGRVDHHYLLLLRHVFVPSWLSIFESWRFACCTWGSLSFPMPWTGMICLLRLQKPGTQRPQCLNSP